MPKGLQRQVPSVVNKPVPPGPLRLPMPPSPPPATACAIMVMSIRAVVVSALEPSENLTFPVRAAAHGALACPCPATHIACPDGL